MTRPPALALATFGPASVQGNLRGRFVRLAGAPAGTAAPRRVPAPPLATTPDTLVSRVGPRVVRTPIPARVADQTRAAGRHREAVRALIDAGLSRAGGIAALPAESPAGVSSGRLERAAFTRSETLIRAHRADVLSAPASFARGGWPTALAHSRAIADLRAEIATLATPRAVSAAERSREAKIRKRAALASAADTPNLSAAFSELAALRAAAARAAGGRDGIDFDSRDTPRPNAAHLAYTEPTFG